MHDKNTIHRDLKLENILITSDGIVKIADFGLSKVLLAGRLHTYSNCGTLDYESPEMI